MMGIRPLAAVAVVGCLAASGGVAWAGVQGAGERAAQNELPKSASALWATLRKTRIGQDVKRGLFTASFPTEVKALDGSDVTVTGFILPLDSTPKTRHFLISKYTPVCFFCPPGEPNEVVEVKTRTGLATTDRLVTVKGRLSLINKADQGLFFQIADADAR